MVTYTFLDVLLHRDILTGLCYKGRKPTSATSEESRINVAKNSMPWQGEGDGTTAREQFKYVSSLVIRMKGLSVLISAGE